MKTKPIGSLILAGALCLSLSGCLPYETESVPPSSAPVSHSQPVDAAQRLTEWQQQRDQAQPQSQSVAPVPETKLEITYSVIEMMGQRNSWLIQRNGEACFAGVVYGGTPVADYHGLAVEMPFDFWLQGDFEDTWWEYSDGHGNAPQFNFWPEDFIIWGIHAYGDAIPLFFETSGPVTYPALCSMTGQQPELHFEAEEEQFNYSYGMDVWHADFIVGPFILQVVFCQKGDDYAVYDVYLLRQV